MCDKTVTFGTKLSGQKNKDKDNKVSTHKIFVCEQIKVFKFKTKEYN